MTVTSREVGVPGERDEDGYLGYYSIGREHIFVGETGFLMGIQLNATPQELLFYAGRVQGTDLLRLTRPESDPFVQEAARRAYRLADIQQVYIVGSRIMLGP